MLAYFVMNKLFRHFRRDPLPFLRSPPRLWNARLSAPAVVLMLAMRSACKRAIAAAFDLLSILSKQSAVNDFACFESKAQRSEFHGNILNHCDYGNTFFSGNCQAL